MPLTVHLLALAVFAQGTSEFMLSGLLPAIAGELRVSVPTAGLLVSAFAAGMVVGAPLMAVLTSRLSRRRSLLTFFAVFLLAHVAGALTSDFTVLLGTRIVAALANAGFLAVALVTASAMVGPERRARATSVLLAGVTLACVVGVPAGAVLGQVWGWRSAFWAVALLSVPAVVGVLWSVPAGSASATRGVRGELAALRRPRLLVVLLLGALVNAATFCTFTYLAPLTTDVAGLAPGRVPLTLALFGLGSFVGVTAAGRITDGTRLLAVGGPALLAGWIVLAVAPATLLPVVMVQGALSFAVGSTLIARALAGAGDAPTLAGAYATTAFNVGAVLGPSAGGIAIGAGLGYGAPVWVSVGLVSLALMVGLGSAGLGSAGLGSGRVGSGRPGSAAG